MCDAATSKETGHARISGSLFALVIAAHAARMFAEGISLLGDPIFVGTTFVAVALTIWAFMLLRRLRRSHGL